MPERLPPAPPRCHGSCPDYPRRLAEYHAEQAYNREQKARISDSIRGVIATLPVDKRNCHVTRTPGRRQTKPEEEGIAMRILYECRGITLADTGEGYESSKMAGRT